MHVVEGVRRNGRAMQRYVGSLGRFDEGVFRRASHLVQELVVMEGSGVIIAEFEEVTGPIQGKQYFRKFGRSRS